MIISNQTLIILVVLICYLKDAAEILRFLRTGQSGRQTRSALIGYAIITCLGLAALIIAN